MASAFAEPSGAPGIPHRWSPALKQAVGTAYEASGARSPVWFTVAQGVLTEIFYPSVDQPQTGDLQFIVTDGKSFFSEQKTDTVSSVSYTADGATVHISGRQKNDRYRFEQDIISDAGSPVVRIRTHLVKFEPGFRFFVLFKPAIGAGGSQNTATAAKEALYATKVSSNVHAALVASVPWEAESAGYVGFSDGWQDLSRNLRLTQRWPEAGPGNVALTGELRLTRTSGPEFELAIAFGASRDEALANAQQSMAQPFSIAEQVYDAGWSGYSSSFDARVIKMHEDKTRRGAIVASLSTPAIPEGENADEVVSGYHLVWPRDLYHAAMGLLAANDSVTPKASLSYLINTQRADGSWAQNQFVNGEPYWRGLQMDEVSFPVLLAEQLINRGLWPKQDPVMNAAVRRAADFIVSHGPDTPQDRWEEIGGYVPSTIAAEIAGLRAAARLLGAPDYARVADDWNRGLEAWTLVTAGPHGSNYFLRASPGGRPTQGEPIELANGAGRAFADEILDGGFLELVRLGVRSAFDPSVASTVAIYDAPDSGVSDGLRYKRYNRDAYGPAHVGGYWPILAGERGMYAVAAGDLARAQAEFGELNAAALSSGLIPEQTPAGLGVACPLVWSHAERLVLRRSLAEKHAFDALQTAD